MTVGGETVVPADGPPHPVPAAISAGFRCIGGEYPDTAFRHLDLSHEHARPESARRSSRRCTPLTNRNWRYATAVCTRNG